MLARMQQGILFGGRRAARLGTLAGLLWLTLGVGALAPDVAAQSAPMPTPMPGANHPRQDYQTFPQASGSTPARTNRGRADLRVSLYSGAHFAGRQRRKNE